MNTLSDQQITTEIECGFKPTAYDAGVAALPLTLLSDRQFELLVYQLLKDELARGLHVDFDSVSLMQGVRERGRDCCLYRAGQLAGIVQCKRYEERLTKPAVVREILKFLLHSMLDDNLMPGTGTFHYYFCVAEDFTEPANDLIQTFQASMPRADIEKHCKDLIDEYESCVFR